MKIIINEAFIEKQGDAFMADANTPKVAIRLQSPAINVQLAAMDVQSQIVNVQLARSHP